ncbi:MAG: exo-alpha-sialidase, partial [Succiniclasticum sp.]
MLKQFIYQAKEGQMVHGSCLAALPDGRLLCTWFGGSHEGAADTEIWFSVGHSAKDSLSVPEAPSDEEQSMHCNWSPAVCLTKEEEACWNPVLLVYREHVFLYYKTGNQIANWQTKVMVARTDTLYWSPARLLVPDDVSGGRGPVRTKPIVLISGRICAGGSVERGEWQSFCDFSDDAGQTWTKSAMLGLNLLTGNAAATSGEGQDELPAELPPLSPQ